ncbi:MAG: ketol-acid reductoisomerase, partial [Chthoniobacterales bacterium]
DVIVFAVPDTKMGEIFREEIAPALRPRQLLLFIHGFAIHYRQVIPPNDVDVVMVAPKGLGRMVRTQFVEGKGVPCVFAIQQDATGRARALALAYAKAIGGGRAGIIETTFAEETEADMFAEQAVLCGGMSALIEAGFETLVKAGYQPEMAYFECLHELKFIVDLVHRAGIAGMRERISETAKWGDVSIGPKIIDKNVRKQMEAALRKIQNRSFAKEWLRETATGRKRYRQLLERGKNQPIEKVGERLRALMPWLAEKTL